MKKFFDSIVGKLIIIGICPVFVIIMVSIATVITVKNMDIDEETTESVTYEVIDVELAADAAELENDLTADIAEAVKTGNPKVSSEHYARIDSVETDNEAAAAILKTLIGSRIGEFITAENEISFDYGENAETMNTIMPEQDPDEYEVNEDSDTEVVVIMTYNEGEFMTDGFAEKAGKAAEGYSESISVNTEDFTVESVVYTVTIDRETKRITRVHKTMTVVFDGDAVFTGKLASFGTVKAKAQFVTEEIHNISYAGIRINTSEFNFSKGDYNTLDITANMAEGVADEDWKLEFISSDESIATVDENGQVEAVAEEGEAVITARLTYLGQVFEDTCPVHVKPD